MAFVQIRMQSHEVALFEQPIHFGIGDALHPVDQIADGRVVGEHPHIEASSAPVHGLADASEADDAEHFGRAVAALRDIATQEQARPPDLVLPRPHVAIGRYDVSRDGHEQCPSEVGRRIREHTGRIGDGEAELGRRLHVDIVVAHGVVGDAAQPLTGGEHALVHGLRQERDEHVRRAHTGENALPRHDRVFDLHCDGELTGALQNLETGFGNFARCEKLHVILLARLYLL